MKLGFCHNETVAAIAKQAGADYLEQNVQDLLRPSEPDSVVADRLGAARAAPLPSLAANCFLPARLKCVGPDVDTAAILHYADTAFRRAAQAGIRLVVFGSGGARAVPAGFSADQAFAQFVEINSRMAPLAARWGVTLVIEPLNRGECNFINSLAEGAAVVEAVNHAAVRLLADIYHMLRDDEPPDAIRQFGHLLRHAHIAEKANRTAPGVAGDDFRPYLRALRDAGYDQTLSLECRWDNFAAEAPGAIRALRRQLATL